MKGEDDSDSDTFVSDGLKRAVTAQPGLLTLIRHIKEEQLPTVPDAMGDTAMEFSQVMSYLEYLTDDERWLKLLPEKVASGMEKVLGSVRSGERGPYQQMAEAEGEFWMVLLNAIASDAFCKTEAA
jgi:hypothetical protein